MENKNFHNVSLGQGQEVVAESALDIAAEKGHWVILQVTSSSDDVIIYSFSHPTEHPLGGEMVDDVAE